MVTIFKNIKELSNAGDFLPYDTLRPILLKVDSARQLRQLEINSPQIEGETGEVWLKLIEKDFPMEYRAHLFKPPDSTKWYKVYDKYKRIHDRALQESEAKLREALEGLKEDREKNTSKIVGQKVAPRYVKKRSGPKDHTVSTMTFNRGSRTKALTGAGLMRKVRRETKEIANIHGSLSKVTNPSAHRTAARQIRQAPAAMLKDYERAAKPIYRPLPKAPAEPPAVVTQHEARATYISDSGSDDEGGYEDEELFDDHRVTKGGFARPAPAPPSSVAGKNGGPPPMAKRPSTALSARKGRGLLSSGRSPNVVIKTTSSRPKEPMSPVSGQSRHVQNDKRVQSPNYDSSKRPSASPMPSRSTGTDRTSARIMDEDEEDYGDHLVKPEASRVAAETSLAPKPMMRKRKPVDVFMRSNKKRG